MTKKCFFLLSLIVLFSSQVYSGMEQTKTCLANIESLKDESNSLQMQINQLLVEENTIKSKYYNLEKAKKGFSHLPLIPSGIRKSKLAKINNDIDIINTKLDEFSNMISTIQKTLEAKQVKLSLEQNKLQNYKFITITSISVNAWGNWDLLLGPEIRVKMGEYVIANGPQDSSHLSSSLSEDATNYECLYVYDEDPTHMEYMGEIPLEKKSLPKGVSGDFGIKTVKGSMNSNNKSACFSYTVEYKVEF